MLTRAELRMQAATGMVPVSRLTSLAHAYRCKADDLRGMADRHRDGINSQGAAAMRGKAMGYTEAARDVDRVIQGLGLHPHARSSATAKARAYWERRRARLAG